MSEIFAARYQDNPYLPKIGWLNTLQKNQLEQFLQRGFPTRKEERWKYTDVSLLAKSQIVWAQQNNSSFKLPTCFAQKNQSIRLLFVNGYFMPHLSDLNLLPKDVLLCSTSQALTSHNNLMQSLLTEFDAQQYPFASLNSALMTDGIVLSIPKNTKIETPIYCLYFNSQQNNVMTCPRNIIVAGENSQVTWIEEYKGEDVNSITNALTTIHAGSGSKIECYKIQAEASQATHIANTFVMQEQDSVFKSFHLAIGSQLARDNVRVALQAPGAECHLNGFYQLTHDGQHIDNQLHVDHIAELGSSNMFFKGILDKKSRAVFNGKVYVHKDAQKINAQQANHNLLLSQNAEVNTKPELEIYADDVKCTHGATVGQLDLESLFYLRARGIEKNHAMAILTQAFASDVFNKIDCSAVRQYMEHLGGQHAE